MAKKSKNEQIKPENTETEFVASERLVRELVRFLEYAPPGRLRKNRRKMFLLYLSYEQEDLPLDFDDYILDLYGLLEFLDTAEEETRGVWEVV